MRTLALWLALVGGALSCRTVPSSEFAATPQRPTVSADTSTTAWQTFELEAGALWDPSDEIDTPMTLKYGFDPRTEVFAGWSPVGYVSRPGEDGFGVGDLVLGTRHRVLDETDGTPSAAFQGAVKLPVADEDEGLGSGETDFALAGILTRGFGDFVGIGYWQLDLLGSPSGGFDVGHSLAIATATPVVGQIAWFGELAAVIVPEHDDEALFTTIGATYNPRPSLLFDVGAVVGLNDDAPDFQLVAGFTQNLGRVAVQRRTIRGN